MPRKNSNKIPCPHCNGIGKQDSGREVNGIGIQDDCIPCRGRGNAVWITRNGARIFPQDMDTQHIINTIRMLERNGKVSKRTHDHYLYANTDMLGENALDAFNQEADEILDKSPSAWIDIFNDELTKRRVESIGEIQNNKEEKEFDF
jgi:hypothetical protein